MVFLIATNCKYCCVCLCNASLSKNGFLVRCLNAYIKLQVHVKYAQRLLTSGIVLTTVVLATSWSNTALFRRRSIKGASILRTCSTFGTTGESLGPLSV
jgi:hypothetical protein